MTDYVVGFAIDEFERVALVLKNRPEWQAGLLNGIGGKVEPGELPIYAMVREFEEEAGMTTSTIDWENFLILYFDGGTIYFYRAFIPLDPKTMTDEEVVIRWARDVESYTMVPNLSWILPLALYRDDNYTTIAVRQH